MMGGFEVLAILLFLFFPFLFWLWTLIDALRSDFKHPNDKILWVVLIVLMPILGSILYLFLARSMKVR
jgi:hypothetical protein